MTTLGDGDAITILHELGWPSRVLYRTALTTFQLGYSLGAPLAADGLLGPATSAALLTARQGLVKGVGTASPHFRWTDFLCRCGATLTGCNGILVRRELLTGLEQLRAAYYRDGLLIRSGYRCAAHNAQTPGAAPNSQHVYGAAADIDYRVSVPAMRGLRVFSGIGFSQSSRLVRHVDVRHVAGHNLTLSSTLRPATWPYAS